MFVAICVKRTWRQTDDHRTEAAAQLHRIRAKVNAAREMFEASRKISPADDHRKNVSLDWNELKGMSIESIIEFIEKKKDEAVEEALTTWNHQIGKDYEICESRLACERCKGCSKPDSWRDHWSVSPGKSPSDGVWIRHHNKPKAARFTPSKTVGGPVNCDNIAPIRVTIGKYEDGQNIFDIDDWTDGKMAHRKSEKQWTGITVFHSLTSRRHHQ